MSRHNCDHTWSRIAAYARSPSSHTRRWFTNLLSNGIGVKQRTRRLRNVQRSLNEMRKVTAWQRAAVGVAVSPVREGIR